MLQFLIEKFSAENQSFRRDSTRAQTFTFRAQYNQDQNPRLLNLLSKHNLIKELIKKLFSVHYLFTLPSFPFQLIQSVLIRVMTFANWFKKNALALYKLVRK